MNNTILLVEDNPDDVKLTLRAFRRDNLRTPIAVARDGVEALDYLFARGEYAARAGEPPPALVVLDLKLPRLDGLDVLKAMRADPRTQRVPVVVLTASNEEQDLLSSYALGAHRFVQKPVNPTEFVQVAKLLGLYWLNLTEPLPAYDRGRTG